MQTIYLTSDQTTTIPPQSVITIGNFDGVHLGHQAILKTTKQIAEKNNVAAIALTLEPHPRCIFNPTQACTRLTSLAKKSHLMSQLGIDFLLVLPFSKEFAKTSAQDFVEHLLYQHLKVNHVIVGKNFVFGLGRQGTSETLHQLGKEFSFEVTVHSPITTLTGQAYSSTLVRECLAEGNIKEATKLLGRPWEIEGQAILKEYPDINLDFLITSMPLRDFLVPAFGVYAGYITIKNENSPTLPAIVSIGMRSSLLKEEPYCEIQLVDHNINLQGRSLSFQFTEFLRKEKKFDTIDALKVQIATDRQQARYLLAA